MRNLFARGIHRRRSAVTVENFQRGGKSGGFARREAGANHPDRGLRFVAARYATARHE
ncbi:MAG: hypothetical protein WDN28_06895 [Chthoniobacter sp.]